MKYKILKGTELFKKLTEIYKRMQYVKKEADMIVEEVGAEGCAHSTGAAAGGIRGFYFSEYLDKKEGWRKLEKGCTKWFFPKSGDKSNKDLLKRIYELPTVDLDEVQKALQYKTQSFASDGGICFSTCPNVEWKKDCILISVDENAAYTPLLDMIEVTVSEYKKLQEGK